MPSQYGIVIGKNFLSTELLIGSTGGTISNGQEFKFNDIPQLRKQGSIYKVYGITAYSATSLSKSPGTNATVIPDAGASGLVCTFLVDQFEQQMWLPYYELIASLNNGVIRAFEPMWINFQKSYVKITDTTNLTAGQAVVFGFWYEEAKPAK